ncbi:MAG: hypothetical protein K2K30_09955 [Alistipes sp.]|nr:hypothetical protein [Alistipes sp.]
MNRLAAAEGGRGRIVVPLSRAFGHFKPSPAGFFRNRIFANEKAADGNIGRLLRRM